MQYKIAKIIAKSIATPAKRWYYDYSLAKRKKNKREGETRMVNSKLLKSKMAEENITQDYLADRLKLSQPTLSLKLNNNRSFTIDEMLCVVDVLNIEPADLRKFFLA